MSDDALSTALRECFHGAVLRAQLVGDVQESPVIPNAFWKHFAHVWAKEGLSASNVDR
jgi:hypothetical protein